MPCIVAAVITVLFLLAMACWEWMLVLVGLQVVDVIADLMEERKPSRPGRRGGAQQEQSQLSWAEVRQRLEARFGLPFEDLCVRLPQGGSGMGMFITSEQWVFALGV
jgi:hypothetical protein